MAHVLAEVVGEQHVLLGMLQLLPVAVVADLLLVLLAERLALQTFAGCKRGDTHGRRLNLPLKKKHELCIQTSLVKLRQLPAVAEYLTCILLSHLRLRTCR